MDIGSEHKFHNFSVPFFFMYFGVSFSLLFYLSGERQDMSLSIYANLALVRCINCITA